MTPVDPWASHSIGRGATEWNLAASGHLGRCMRSPGSQPRKADQKCSRIFLIVCRLTEKCVTAEPSLISLLGQVRRTFRQSATVLVARPGFIRSRIKTKTISSCAILFCRNGKTLPLRWSTILRHLQSGWQGSTVPYLRQPK